MKIIGEPTDLFAQGYFVYDSKKSGLGHGVAPALRARADPLDLPDRRRRLRRLPPVRPARADEGARRRQARRHVPAQQPVRARTRCGTTCRARSSSRSSTSSIDVLGDRRLRRGPRGRAWATASTRSCSRASSSSPGCCRPTRRSPASRRRSRRPTRSAGRALVERNFAAIDRSLAALRRVERAGAR